MFDREKFFTLARPIFGKYNQDEVDGLNTLLDAWERRQEGDLRLFAYILATVFHETGYAGAKGHMQPIHEYGSTSYFKRMYDIHGSRPHVARALGNTQPGDGARFHGRGYVQLTGRANYQRASLKLGHDFVANPNDVMEPVHAANILFLGMKEGWFTGKKLSDYFSETTSDWYNARRIINGTDKAALIARYAQSFYTALAESLQSPAPAPTPDPDPQPAPEPGPEPALLIGWAAFWQAIRKLFHR